MSICGELWFDGDQWACYGNSDSWYLNGTLRWTIAQPRNQTSRPTRARLHHPGYHRRKHSTTWRNLHPWTFNHTCVLRQHRTTYIRSQWMGSHRRHRLDITAWVTRCNWSTEKRVQTRSGRIHLPGKIRDYFWNVSIYWSNIHKRRPTRVVSDRDCCAELRYAELQILRLYYGSNVRIRICQQVHIARTRRDRKGKATEVLRKGAEGAIDSRSIFSRKQATYIYAKTQPPICPQAFPERMRDAI